MKLPAIRMDALTGLRGIAALYVISFHYDGFLISILHAAPLRFLRMGNLGVDLFFILSGFVLAHVHLDDFTTCAWPQLKSQILSFLKLRLARIYPLHLVTFLATVIYFTAKHVAHVTVKHPEEYTLISAIANLLLIHSWGIFSTLTWNGPSWSISVEWFLYLLFPFLAILLRCSRITLAGLFALFSLIATMLILNFVFNRPHLSATYDYGLILGTGEFICGMCLNIIYRKNNLSVNSLAWVANLSALIVLAALIAGYAYLAVFAMALLILGLTYQHSTVARILSHRHFIHLGEISYSLYLWHVFILSILFAPMTHATIKNPVSPMALVLWAVSLPLVLFVAEISYKYIEKPARALLSQRA